MNAPAGSESTLEERLAQGPLRPEAAARLGVLACRAAAVAPRKPGARRDLGPSAIALETSPEGEVTVVLRAETDRARRSPMYLSPEEVTNASPPDARSDVYSLCTALYEALSGALPFPRCATEEELLSALISRDPVPLEAAAPGVDRGLVAVVARGLQRNPARRWASPRDLGDALAPFTGGSEGLDANLLSPPRAEPPAGAGTAAAAPGAGAWPRRGALAAAVLVVFAAGIGVGWVARHSGVTGVTGLEPVPTSAPRPPLVVPANAAEKRQVAETLLQGKSFFVHLDPRRPGVVVPEKLRADSQLVLQLGRALAVPIPDLAIGDAGITATLSFSRKPFLCKIPWSAVYAMVDEDGLGRIWEADVPPEEAKHLQRPPGLSDAGP